jgi:hypothetical protein
MAIAVTKECHETKQFWQGFVVDAVFAPAVGTIFVDEPLWCFLRKSF